MHADTSSFNIQCNLQGCSRTFKNFKTYKTHIYAYHNTTSFELTSEQCGEETREEDRDDSAQSDHDWANGDHDGANGDRDWANGDCGDEVLGIFIRKCTCRVV